MKKILLFLTSFLIGVLLFVWVVNFVGWEEIKNSFLVFKGWEGIVVLCLTFLTIILGNLKWKEILKGEGVKISFWELLKLYLAGFSVMFLAPVLVWVGEIFRGYGLKKSNKALPWSKCMASVIIDRVLEWTVNLIVIVLGLLFFLYNIGLPPKNLIVVFGSVFLVFIAAISVFYIKVFKKESIAKTFGRVLNGTLDKEPLETEKEIFNFFKPERKSMWKSFAISFLRAGVMYIRVCFLINFLKRKTSLISSLSILGFTYLAAMIPIPTSLGSHEAIQSFAFNSLGLGISTAAAFTIIIRAAELFFALMGFIIMFRFWATFFKKILFKEADKFSGNKNLM